MRCKYNCGLLFSLGHEVANRISRSPTDRRPEGCEAAARDFYGALLGMQEIEKPEPLRARGGCWFECVTQQLHIGVEKDSRAPAHLRQPHCRSSLGLTRTS